MSVYGCIVFFLFSFKLYQKVDVDLWFNWLHATDILEFIKLLFTFFGCVKFFVVSTYYEWWFFDKPFLLAVLSNRFNGNSDSCKQPLQVRYWLLLWLEIEICEFIRKPVNKHQFFAHIRVFWSYEKCKYTSICYMIKWKTIYVLIFTFVSYLRMNEPFVNKPWNFKMPTIYNCFSFEFISFFLALSLSIDSIRKPTNSCWTNLSSKTFLIVRFRHGLIPSMKVIFEIECVCYE